jgi:tetratricopeptide (TPR) repeat protein
MDSYTSNGDFVEADKVVDEALQTDSLHELFLYAKSNIMLNLQRFADCLRYSERLLERNAELSDAYYNAGIACLNIAQRIDSRKYKKQIKRMYQRALPYMEAYRRLEPSQKDKWGPALYRIYFNLNMGKQFDEIDKILKK